MTERPECATARLDRAKPFYTWTIIFKMLLLFRVCLLTIRRKKWHWFRQPQMQRDKQTEHDVWSTHRLVGHHLTRVWRKRRATSKFVVQLFFLHLLQADSWNASSSPSPPSPITLGAKNWQTKSKIILTEKGVCLIALFWQIFSLQLWQFIVCLTTTTFWQLNKNGFAQRSDDLTPALFDSLKYFTFDQIVTNT